MSDLHTDEYGNVIGEEELEVAGYLVDMLPGPYADYLTQIAGAICASYNSCGYDHAIETRNELRNIRVIEENHYDQDMDEDPNRPDWESLAANAGGYYIFFIN